MRLKIVTDCLANDKNYGANGTPNMIILSTSSQLGNNDTKRWVKRVWKTVVRTSCNFSSKAEHLKKSCGDKIAELERRNLDLQMENDLLKKSEENWKGGSLSLIHQLAEYEAIQNYRLLSIIP